MTIILVYLAAVMLTALGILIAYRKCILRSKAIPSSLTEIQLLTRSLFCV